MASTITTIVLLTIFAQLTLATILTARYPESTRTLLSFLLRVCDLIEPKRTARHAKPKRQPAPLIAIDRSKPNGDDTSVVETLVELGATRVNAVRMVTQARKTNPDATLDSLLAASFKLIRVA